MSSRQPYLFYYLINLNLNSMKICIKYKDMFSYKTNMSIGIVFYLT